MSARNHGERAGCISENYHYVMVKAGLYAVGLSLADGDLGTGASTWGRGQVFIAIEDCLKAPKMLDAGAEFGSGVNSLSWTMADSPLPAQPEHLSPHFIRICYSLG